MSLNKNILLICCGLICGLSMPYFLSNKSRKPANVQLLPPQGKPNHALEISVEPIGGIPDSDTQELTLKATVKLLDENIKELDFSWSFPEEVSVVSGQKEDSWANVKVGNTLQTEITVTGLSKKSGASVIVFNAFKEINGIKIGNSAVFTPNSIPPFYSGNKTGSFMKAVNGRPDQNSVAPQIPAGIQF